VQVAGSPFRIIDNRNYCIVLSDSIYIFSYDLSEGGAVISGVGDPKSLYSISWNGLDTFISNFGKNRLEFRSSFKKAEYKPSGYLMSSIAFNGVFYSMSFVPGKGNDINTIELHAWEPKSDGKRLIADISNHMKPYLENDEQCLENRLEGSFFKISDSSFGYYFYRSSRFLIYDNGAIKLGNGIVNYPFVKFRNEEVEMGGEKFSMCQPVVDAWVQMGAAGNDDGRLYFLNNIIAKGQEERTVDVYDARSLKYRHSFLVPNEKSEQPSDIIVKGSKMILIYESGTISSYEFKN
jgi:hypothetical protein